MTGNRNIAGYGHSSTLSLHDGHSNSLYDHVMFGISVGNTFSSIMAMITKYLVENVKEELIKSEEVFTEILQTSRNIVESVEKIE